MRSGDIEFYKSASKTVGSHRLTSASFSFIKLENWLLCLHFGRRRMISTREISPAPSATRQENATLSRIREGNDDFNYHLIKQKFYEEVDEYYSSKNSRKCKKMTKKEIVNTIAEIKRGKSLAALGQPQTANFRRLCNRYKIIEENGQELMVLRKTDPEGNQIRVVAVEDVFDIILEAHVLCGHGGRNRTVQFMNSLYCVPNVLTYIFVKLCNVCAKTRYPTNSKTYSQIADGRITFLRFNHTVKVGYINMKAQPDGPFNHILYYIDNVTEFFILRPLESFGKESDLSEELLNIFADFGPPMKIETYYSYDLKCSLSLLKVHCPDWEIEVVQMTQDFNTLLDLITKALQNWMEENECLNWSIGCRMLQFEKNTAKVVNKLLSPFNNVFGYNSNCELFKDINIDIENCDISEESTDTVFLVDTVKEEKYDNCEKVFAVKKI